MENESQILIREAKILVWGPIYVTLNLEKVPSVPIVEEEPPTQTPVPVAVPETKGKINEAEDASDKTDSKRTVNILTPISQPQNQPSQVSQPKQDNSKKVTYIYNLIDHGLDCECVDVKGELLIRSALPVYRKITQGIEFEQITSNQLKLIITSRVLDNYQEVFQGFTTPKATFRIWIMGYKFS